MYPLKSADRTLASLFPSTVSIDVPISSEGKTGASSRKYFSFSLSAKFNHRCLSLATIGCSIAAAVYLVARRSKSLVQHTSTTAGRDSPCPWSKPLSRSTWYACDHHHVQRTTSLACCRIRPAAQTQSSLQCKVGSEWAGYGLSGIAKSKVP